MNQVYKPTKNKVIIIFRYWDSAFFGLTWRPTIDYIKGTTLNECMIAFDLISETHKATEILEICTKTE